MDSFKYKFTVFTPTYNRERTLERVFESLSNQTLKSFEWLIVDDGSTDDTKKLVMSVKSKADFSIRYFRQENGGKHRAFNNAVKLANGEFFLTLDSDDYCVPQALEVFAEEWNKIPANKKEKFSGISGLCMDENGNIVGDPFPYEPFDSNSVQIRNKYKIKGEKWGFQRTEILKKYPYPEFKGEKYISPSIVWNKISLEYMTRYINKKLRIYELSENSITKNHLMTRIKSPKGSMHYYNELMSISENLKKKIRASINYIRFSCHSGNRFKEIIKNSKMNIITIFIFPVGYSLYLIDRKYLKSN